MLYYAIEAFVSRVNGERERLRCLERGWIGGYLGVFFGLASCGKLLQATLSRLPTVQPMVQQAWTGPE